MTKPTLAPARLKIDEPLDNPRNPKKHDDTQLSQLAASYKKFGQPRPILIRADNRMIVAGHGMRAAMKRAGATEIDVMLWAVDQKTADKFMLADNRHGANGADDPARVRELLAEAEAKEFAALGFTEEDAAALLEDAEVDDLAVQTIATGPVEDRFWISVRGKLVHQADALQILQRAMKDLPDVEVSLGTVAED